MAQQLTLSALNLLIKDALIDAFPGTLWVVAEVSELKENRSGHCYLELIEKKGNEIIARSRATIWSYTFRMLKPYFETTTGQAFRQGIKILAQVTVEYHTAYGLSLNIKDIDPSYTIGDLALQRREIVERLKREGVFEMNKELELPLVPQKIAIISSATAAGYQDFMKQLEHNASGFKFYTQLFEAYMQGAETVPSVIHALERIFQYDDFFDAVVIIRGGGATADLSSFDSYELAINVTQFPLPVITGIGHEKDDTIIDLVAHTRLKTPTAVAEFLITGMDRFYSRLQELENRIIQFSRESIDEQKDLLERIAASLSNTVDDFIQQKQQQLAKSGHQLQRSINNYSYKKHDGLNVLKHRMSSSLSVLFVENKNHINRQQRILKRMVGEVVLKNQSNLKHVQDVLVAQAHKKLYKERERMKRNENTVRLLNPENVLKRGFTLTLKDGKIIKSVSELKKDDELVTQFADGNIRSKITKKNR